MSGVQPEFSEEEPSRTSKKYKHVQALSQQNSGLLRDSMKALQAALENCSEKTESVHSSMLSDISSEGDLQEES